MFNNKKVIAIIPARAGSKGVPNKNIKLLGGKPLIAWPIDVAKQSKYIDEIVVSTDGELIAKKAIELGAKVIKRPAELSQDNSLVIDTIKHVIKVHQEKSKDIDIVVILEATCPFRRVEDVDSTIEKLMEFDSVASFVEASLNPHRAWKIESDTVNVFIPDAIPWLPRQELPKAYQLNGGVYTFWADKLEEKSITPLFGKMGAVLMSKEHSLDIDTEFDFFIAENYIKDLL